MEQWEEIHKGQIPPDHYQVSLQNGEINGLVIILESKEHIVKIFFGAASAIRMLDEGIIVNELFDEQQLKKYRKGGFSNTIYRITGGEFGRFSEAIASELYHYLRLKHFLIITSNYVVEVISQWDPEITILSSNAQE